MKRNGASGEAASVSTVFLRRVTNRRRVMVVVMRRRIRKRLGCVVRNDKSELMRER